MAYYISKGKVETPVINSVAAFIFQIYFSICLPNFS